MDKEFAQRLSHLQQTIKTQELDWDFVIDLEQVEEAAAILSDYREALEKIAYPANYPDPEFFGLLANQKHTGLYREVVGNWKATVAANALTNGGKRNDARKDGDSA